MKKREILEDIYYGLLDLRKDVVELKRKLDTIILSQESKIIEQKSQEVDKDNQ